MGEYSQPGYRFSPTDVELVMYYLKRKVLGKKFPFESIAEVDIYKYAPWDLPYLSSLKTTGNAKWFFFCPVGKKYARGTRLNRATLYGYWKVTGKDRPVTYNDKVVGRIKSLVFHKGKPPRGDRTDWVMHEYRLEEKELGGRGIVQDSFVLSVIFNKDGMGPRNGAQYGAPFKEEDWSDDEDCICTHPDPIAKASKVVPEAVVGVSDAQAAPVLMEAPQHTLLPLDLVAFGTEAPLVVSTETNDAPLAAVAQHTQVDNAQLTDNASSSFFDSVFDDEMLTMLSYLTEDHDWNVLYPFE